MKLFTMIALLLLIFATSGCALIGLEEEEEDTTDTATAAIPEMEGTWKKSCYLNDDSGYSEDSLTHSGSEILLENKMFLDSSCGDVALTMRFTLNEISKGSATTLSDGSSGYLYNFKIKSATLESLLNLMTDSLNSGGVCGKTNWQTNVAQDIAGTDCFTGNVGDAGVEKYGISGNSLNLELFGQTYTKQ